VACERREDLELDESRPHELASQAHRPLREVDRELPGDQRLGPLSAAVAAAASRIEARRSAAFTRLRNSRIENGFVM